MKSISVALSHVLALLATTPAFARAHNHHGSYPPPYEHVNSGYGPPMNWNEIEISHPEGGG
jgi:hypothetical protein